MAMKEEIKRMALPTDASGDTQVSVETPIHDLLCSLQREVWV